MTDNNKTWWVACSGHPPSDSDSKDWFVTMATDAMAASKELDNTLEYRGIDASQFIGAGVFRFLSWDEAIAFASSRRGLSTEQLP